MSVPTIWRFRWLRARLQTSWLKRSPRRSWGLSRSGDGCDTPLLMAWDNGISTRAVIEDEDHDNTDPDALGIRGDRGRPAHRPEPGLCQRAVDAEQLGPKHLIGGPRQDEEAGTIGRKGREVEAKNPRPMTISCRGRSSCMCELSAGLNLERVGTVPPVVPTLSQQLGPSWSRRVPLSSMEPPRPVVDQDGLGRSGTPRDPAEYRRPVS
jgi:hypothetical protein